MLVARRREQARVTNVVCLALIEEKWESVGMYVARIITTYLRHHGVSPSAGPKCSWQRHGAPILASSRAINRNKSILAGKPRARAFGIALLGPEIASRKPSICRAQLFREIIMIAAKRGTHRRLEISAMHHLKRHRRAQLAFYLLRLWRQAPPPSMASHLLSTRRRQCCAHLAVELLAREEIISTKFCEMSAGFSPAPTCCRRPLRGMLRRFGRGITLAARASAAPPAISRNVTRHLLSSFGGRDLRRERASIGRVTAAASAIIVITHGARLHSYRRQRKSCFFS